LGAGLGLELVSSTSSSFSWSSSAAAAAVTARIARAELAANSVIGALGGGLSVPLAPGGRTAFRRAGLLGAGRSAPGWSRVRRRITKPSADERNSHNEIAR